MPKRAKVPPKPHGFYVVQSMPQVAPGHVKLGVSSNVPARLKTYQSLSPSAQVVKIYSHFHYLKHERDAMAYVENQDGCERIGPEAFNVASLEILLYHLDAFWAAPHDVKVLPKHQIVTTHIVEDVTPLELPPILPLDRLMFTPEEVCAHLNISKEQFHKLDRSGALRTRHLTPRTVRVSRAAIEDYQARPVVVQEVKTREEVIVPKNDAQTNATITLLIQQLNTAQQERDNYKLVGEVLARENERLQIAYNAVRRNWIEAYDEVLTLQGQLAAPKEE
jgi:hypothetical protein